MTILVRPAKLTDIPLLVKARVAFLAALGHPIPEEELEETKAQVAKFLEQNLGKSMFSWIAMDGDEIAAAGFLQLFHVMAHFNAPSGHYGRITNMLTWPAYRSSGLARQIISHLLEKARQCELDYVNLDASDLGRPLYESLGFIDYVAEDPPMVLYLRKN